MSEMTGDNNLRAVDEMPILCEVWGMEMHVFGGETICCFHLQCRKQL